MKAYKLPGFKLKQESRLFSPQLPRSKSSVSTSEHLGRELSVGVRGELHPGQSLPAPTYLNHSFHFATHSRVVIERHVILRTTFSTMNATAITTELSRRSHRFE